MKGQINGDITSKYTQAEIDAIYNEWAYGTPSNVPYKGESNSNTSSQPTQADNGRGRFSQTRQSYLENAEQKKEQQRALDAIRPQLNFPQYETVEQTRAALKGFEEKNRALVNDPLSEVLYEGDVKKYTDQINLLSKFESGELSADFFGRGLDENSLAGQMQKDKAATEQRRAAQQYEAEVSQRISDGLSTEGAMNEKFAPRRQMAEEQPEEEQNAVDRFMNLISGIGKGNAAAATGGQRLLYELGQGARSQMNEEAYAQAKADYDRALQAYEEELAAWGEQGARSAYYVLQDAKRRLDAFGTVVEDEVQQKATQAASTLSQELNKQSGEDIEKAKEGLGTVGRIAVDTGAALGDILIDAASGMGALNMAGRVFGRSAIEAEAAGANTAQQLAYGTATAAFATGLNKVIDGLAGVYGKGFGDDAAEAFIAKIASTDKGRNVARAILNIGGEGAEEFTEGAVEPLLKLIYDGGDAIKAVYSSPEAWSEALLDNLYSAAIGSVIGAGGQAVDIATGGYSAKNAATPLQPSDYVAPQWGLKPTSPQSAQESTGGTQIPPSTQTASTNAPDVLNSGIQPQSPADILVEVATGQKNTAPTQGTPSVSNLGQGRDNGRTSQSASTVFEAGITPEARRAELEPFIQNGRFDYVPDSNARQTVRATRAIMKAGWKKSADDFKADVAAGKSGKDLVARGAVLLNNLSNSEASSQEYMDMVDSYIELMHRAGETLQAGKIVQQLTPEGRLYLIGKSIDRLNRNLTDSQRRKAAKKQGVEADEMRITVDPTLVDMYRAAQTDAERDAVIDEMQQNIAEQVPSTFGEKLTAFRYTAMLGNFKTQIRNLTGNAASVTTKLLVKDRLAAAVEAIAKASGAEIEQTRSIAVSPALWKAAWNDFPANRDAALGEEKYTSASQQMEKGIQDKRTVFKSKALEGWRKGTQWAMQAGDSIFGRIAYADALGGWLQAHNVNFETATDEQLTRARSFAAKEAQEAVFRDKNAISDAVSSLGSNWKNSNSTFKKTVATIGEGIQPFRKTPANVLVRAEEYSPLGFINTVSAAVKAGKGEAEINDVINSAAKAMTGSALAAAGYFFAAAGRLRGVEDDEELDKAQKANGAMDWSLVTDDGKYIALSQFAPATVPLFMGVRLAELTRGQDIEPKDIIEIIKGTTAPMFEMSMLSGLDSAFSDLSNYGSDATAFGQFIENALLSYAQQFIPALLRQAEQASEEYRQTTYTDSNNPWLDTNDQYRLGKISAGIPGLDYQQTDYIDMWGRKTEQGNVADRLFDAFINPTYTANSKAEPMDDELERLHKATKDLEDVPSVYPSFIARNTKLDKSGKVMTQKQYENYKISTGTKARELASDFVESKEYKKLSDEQRAKVLSDLYSLASSQALKSAKRSQGITGDGLKTDWDMEASLSAPAKFIAETVMAKADAERRGESFTSKSRNGVAYYSTRGFSDSDMDKLAADLLSEKQNKVYEAFRQADISPAETMELYAAMDGEKQDGSYAQADVFALLFPREDMTKEQKSVVWANTQQSKTTDWATYLAKNAR